MSPSNDLAARIGGFSQPEDAIHRRLNQIRGSLLADSRDLRDPNFRRIHVDDLAHLFEQYDQHFLDGLCQRSLDGAKLSFRLAPRLTRSGGVTKRTRWRNGTVSYEIAVGTSVLFEGFGEGDRTITACGLICASRLDALQRIFEHELVHLLELLCWQHTTCSGGRFQDIARRFFLHREHTHDLITQRERAANSGIRPGVRVAFTYDGRRFIGRVNRITARATVLVEDPRGARYSDGRRYTKFYVPVGALQVVPA